MHHVPIKSVAICAVFMPFTGTFFVRIQYKHQHIQIQTIHTMTTALLIIDVEQALCLGPHAMRLKKHFADSRAVVINACA